MILKKFSLGYSLYHMQRTRIAKFIKTVCGSCLPSFYMNKLLEKSVFFYFRSSLACKLSLSVFRQTSKILYLAGLVLWAILCVTNSFPFLWSLKVSDWLCLPCMKHVNKPLLFFFFLFLGLLRSDFLFQFPQTSKLFLS